MTIQLPPSSAHGIPLDAFSQASRTEPAVVVSASGQSPRVLGVGATPGGRGIAWVAPDVDTTAMFTQALGQTYGSGIASAISRELGLTPSPGKPLSSRAIERALDMAHTSRQTLAGVDFATRLDCSAVAGGPIFLGACKAAGMDPGSVTPQERQRIDQAMQQKFEQAAQSGQSPVAPAAAQGWLRELLLG